MNDIVLNAEVAVGKFGRKRIVGMNAADSGGCQKDIFRFFGGEEGFDIGLAGKIELFRGAINKIGVTRCFKGAHQSRADEAGVTGDVDFRLFIHCRRMSGSRAAGRVRHVWRFRDRF